tara:strand:+ start:1205 stop:1549 length:345 start_codon:yes stop_codon:yes gene_type:complete
MESELRALGLKEHPARGYPPRTRANIVGSNGTLLIGNTASPGSRLTLRAAASLGKPTFTLLATYFPRDLSSHVPAFQGWLKHYDVRVLNVAGNRESVAPGIAKATHDFLVEALG